MTDEPSAFHVVPTELERSDGFLDLAALAGTGLAAWYLGLLGVPLWPMILPAFLVATWTLTGEAAADVPYVGAIAAGLRSKLGLRRAHEWVLAWWHFYRLVTWPEWRQWWAQTRVGQRSSSYGQRLTTRWHRLASARTRWTPSRVSSWASRIRSN